jgi:hypothetical protein
MAVESARGRYSRVRLLAAVLVVAPLLCHRMRLRPIHYTPSRISSARTVACDQARAPCAVGTASLFRSRAMSYALYPNAPTLARTSWAPHSHIPPLS